jgi:hypothetical protein
MATKRNIGAAPPVQLPRVVRVDAAAAALAMVVAPVVPVAEVVAAGVLINPHQPINHFTHRQKRQGLRSKRLRATRKRRPMPSRDASCAVGVRVGSSA